MPKPRFQIGDNVIYKTTGEIGTINKVIPQKYSYAYRVMINGKIKTINEIYLEKYIDEEEEIVSKFEDCDFGHQKEYKIYNSWIRLTRPIEDNIYSYLSSKTIFNPYQFKPLLRFISSYSDQRLFIADEVGVGKTIETGIIIKELIAREMLDNDSPILVVCPASLLIKWRDEMKDKFQFNFYVHDPKSIKNMILSIKKEGVVPEPYTFSIASLQTLRNDKFIRWLNEIYNSIDRPIFGLVVVDEAHHMRNSGTNSNELGNLLSKLSEMMLMLSATPLNLKSDDLYNQLHILNPTLFYGKQTFNILFEPVRKLNRIRKLISEEYEKNKQNKPQILESLKDLKNTVLAEVIFKNPEVLKFIERLKNERLFTSEEVAKYDKIFSELSPLYYSFTRTRKREALSHQVKRVVKDVGVHLSDLEYQYHFMFIKTIKGYYENAGYNPLTVALILNTHRRIVASSIPASRKYLEWAIKERKIEYTTEDELVEDDSQAEYTSIDDDLVALFKTLIKFAKRLENIDTKYLYLREFLRKMIYDENEDKIIVFSFFVKTLGYLKQRLEADGFKVGVIHGNVPLEGTEDAPGRKEIIESFKNGEINVLLSSEVGGEGLDFQFCHVLVNYDLPYNPMRVEQRIGRVDRFGQKSDKIIVANFFIKNTVDEEIYNRLYKRIKLIEEGVGQLEPILGDKMATLQHLIILGNASEDDKEELQKRLEEAIEKAKLETEEFERMSKVLLSDDYLTQAITRLTANNFVTPDNAVVLSNFVVNMWPGCEFKSLKNENISGGILKLNRDKIEELKKFVYHPDNTRGYEELKHLICNKKIHYGIKVIFDGHEAINHPDYVFLPPTGFWVKFLLNYLSDKNLIKKNFSLRISKEYVGFPTGHYVVFIFEIGIRGIKKEIDLIGIPYSLKEKKVVRTDFNSLLNNISKYGEGCNISDCDIDIVKIKEDVDLFLGGYIDEKTKNISEKNNYIINTKIEALKKSAEIKIKKLEDYIREYKEKVDLNDQKKMKHLQLTEAKIIKERKRVSKKIKELEKKRDLSMDYSLDGLILLTVR